MESYGNLTKGPLHGISKGIYFACHEEVVRVLAPDLFCIQHDGAKVLPEVNHGVVPSAVEPRPGKACKFWHPGQPHYLPSGYFRNKCTLKLTKPALR